MTDPHDDSPRLPTHGPALDAVGNLDAGIAARFEISVDACLADATPDQHLLGDRLCHAVVDVLDVDGAGISVYLGADVAVPVGASDAHASTGEGLQFTVREGPCFESYSSHAPVLLPDLRRPGTHAWTTWPTYASQLVQHTPYESVFAYPLFAGAAAFGSLSLYRHVSGPEDGPRGAAGVAERIAARLLSTGMFTGPDGETEHPWMNGPAGLRRRRVWLAQGFTLQANRITPGQAIDVLRAQAFTAGRLLDDLADDIVAGRLPVPVLASE